MVTVFLVQKRLLEPEMVSINIKVILASLAIIITAAPSPALPVKERATRAASVADPAKRFPLSKLVQPAVESPGPPDPRTVLPRPQVEMDVVNLLAEFPKEERPYVQQVVHTVKDLNALNQQCASKAAVFWQKGLPAAGTGKTLDLAEVTNFNQGYLRYFDPLRSYLKAAYRHLYGLKPPARFEKAHKYWLAYLAYALDNLDHQRRIDLHPTAKPAHSPVEVAQYRAWAYRLYKENGLDLTPYLVN